MKKIDIPQFDWAQVKNLCTKVGDVATAQAHWKRNYGVYKSFKSSITVALRGAQSNRCAYCNTRLHEKNPHRDHIAPKSPHYKWTFWPINLVLACYCCNVDCKKEFDTVVVLSPSYRRTEFNIVHPFLDDPDNHLECDLDEMSILIRPKNNSAKGAATIELFNLMAPERAKERAKDLLLDDDVGHLLGLTRDLFMDAMKEIRGHRLLIKPTH